MHFYLFTDKFLSIILILLFMKRASISILIVLLITALTVSCRLDVVEPEPIDTEINQPSQENRLNYLNYELYGENFSTSAIIQLNFSVSKATLNLTLIGHTNGEVKVEIKDMGQLVVFRTELSDNIPTYSRPLNDPHQSFLIVSPNNFTGKLRIRITPRFE